MSAIAKQRRFRSLQESRIIRSLVWHWTKEPPGERCSLRAMARKLGCHRRWLQFLKREFATAAGIERQLRAESTWGAGTWTDLRIERDKRRDDHGFRYRIPRIKRVPPPMSPMKMQLERELRAYLKAHPACRVATTDLTEIQ
jgi:hypothetical protein